jgi:hypothetical protein
MLRNEGSSIERQEESFLHFNFSIHYSKRSKFIEFQLQCYTNYLQSPTALVRRLVRAEEATLKQVCLLYIQLQSCLIHIHSSFLTFPEHYNLALAFMEVWLLIPSTCFGDSKFPRSSN